MDFYVNHFDLFIDWQKCDQGDELSEAFIDLWVEHPSAVAI